MEVAYIFSWTRYSVAVVLVSNYAIIGISYQISLQYGSKHWSYRVQYCRKQWEFVWRWMMKKIEKGKKAWRYFVNKISLIRAFILYMTHIKITCTHQVISIQKLGYTWLILRTAFVFTSHSGGNHIDFMFSPNKLLKHA